ncbi:MAG: hypothetical protein ABJN65_15545 [Parasphingorhabdus sp.]
MTLDPPNEDATITMTPAPAAGLFGYSIINGKMQAYKPMSGYIRDIEQMPNFAPPSAEVFAAQYVASTIGRTRSSS